MSHLLAARCTVCGAVDDPPCPECPGVNGSTHGITHQRPWRHVADDGYVHEWHPDCVPPPTEETP
jgi:uncharacterized OB-fold protein